MAVKEAPKALAAPKDVLAFARAERREKLLG